MKKYVVLSGEKTGVFNDWNEVQNIVQKKGTTGYLWKKCLTEEDVQIFKEKVEKFFIEYKKWESGDTVPLISSDPETLTVYTDGSYDSKNQLSSSAMIFLDNKENVLHKSSFVVTDKELNKGRNVTGEAAAVIEAIRYAIKNDYKKIHIFHDYIGLLKWVVGADEAKEHVSKLYLEFIENTQKKYDIDIKFTWIEAHHDTKDRRTIYNHDVDRLAASTLENYIKKQ